MSQQMTEIVAGLKEEEGKLRGVVEQLRGELKEAEANLGRVSDAIMVLQSGAPKKWGKKKAGGKPKVPAPTRAAVMKIVEGELKEKGVVAVEVLQESVEAAVAAGGLSKMGLALRFKEVVDDGRFKKTEEGLQLAGAE